MDGPARGGEPEPRRARRGSPLGTLLLTLLFVLTAIAVSAGLVVYTAWLQDLESGPFAVLFGVLSAKAAFSWLAWNEQDDSPEPPAPGDQPKQD